MYFNIRVIKFAFPHKTRGWKKYVHFYGEKKGRLEKLISDAVFKSATLLHENVSQNRRKQVQTFDVEAINMRDAEIIS